MPKIGIYKYLVFFIVSYDLSERPHLHVWSKNHKRGDYAKIWLDTLDVFSHGSLTQKEINLALKIIETNKSSIEEIIGEFRTTGKVKTLKLKLR